MTSYRKMEEIIKTINSEFISLKTEEVAHNNELLKSTLEQMISVMKKDSIFQTIYERPFYGGSFYDDLKVGKPDEFDLNLLLDLSKLCERSKTKKCNCIKIGVSDKPGFVWFYMQKDHYPLFNKFIDDGYVRNDLVLNWFKRLVVSALNSLKNTYGLSFTPLYKSESGPAITIRLNGRFGHFDIDIVPAFKWGPEHWLPIPFRQNPSKTKPYFFTVPKKPKRVQRNARHWHNTSFQKRARPMLLDEQYSHRSFQRRARDKPHRTYYWRASFQDQERELIEGREFLKPALRLLKKMRDNLGHRVSSYALKNIVLWELDSAFFNQKNTLSDTFMRLLEMCKVCLRQKKIENYWNRKDNLLWDLNPETLKIYYNEIVRKINEIERSYQANPFIIAKLILKGGSKEYNLFMRKYKMDP